MVTVRILTAIRDSLEVVLATKAREQRGIKWEQKEGGREVPVTGMREMCSILPESRFPRIRYCHPSPKPNPADAAEKVQLTGRRATFKSKFIKIHNKMSTIGLVQRKTSGILRMTEAHPNLPIWFLSDPGVPGPIFVPGCPSETLCRLN